MFYFSVMLHWALLMLLRRHGSEETGRGRYILTHSSSKLSQTIMVQKFSLKSGFSENLSDISAIYIWGVDICHNLSCFLILILMFVF